MKIKVNYQVVGKVQAEVKASIRDATGTCLHTLKLPWRKSNPSPIWMSIWDQLEAEHFWNSP